MNSYFGSGAADRGDDRYFRLMEAELGARGAARLRHQMWFQYHRMEFADRRVLDVGGGNGVHSFFAAARGASAVVNLEPEGHGSTSGVMSIFDKWRSKLGAANVTCLSGTLQDCAWERGTFDVVLIQDAINHLDESACVALRADEASRRSYQALFTKLADLLCAGGVLHFSDCSSVNLFPALGMRNPFDPAIECYKHQPPGVWIAMLRECGFGLVSKRWSTPARFGRVGQSLAGNAFCTYFFTSHFAVTMVKA